MEIIDLKNNPGISFQIHASLVKMTEDGISESETNQQKSPNINSRLKIKVNSSKVV
jgi:hypothetical protein